MRGKFLHFFIGLLCLACVSRLVDLQIVNGAGYRDMSRQRLLRTASIAAPRGEILDCNGKALVRNKTGFSVEIHYMKGRTSEELNSLILRLVKEIESNGEAVIDSVPITRDGKNFSLTDNEVLGWKEKNSLPVTATVRDAISSLSDRYNIDNSLSQQDKRIIAGVRYEMERLGFSANNPYVIASDINETLLTRLKERNSEYPSVVISTAPVREYVNGSTAAHILGRTGKIYKEEYEQLSGQDYNMNDIIGKQGIEKYCERYLKGVDGLSGVEQSVDQSRIKIVESVAPTQGNNVILTIDLNVQKAAEQALADTIQYIRDQSGGGDGYDANCGAVAAVDVNTGDIIALASYPSYNPATFNEDYATLSTDSRAPMFNRAIGGVYEPGSTFKMVTAVAALEEGVITPSEQIEDKGIYEYYDDYKPACWIYRSKHLTHGYQNVSQALENSCNYFFYDVGRRTTIENINKYAKMFGLGESTGIELESEENTGRLTSPELREADGKVWNPGDTLQVAIGQSDNAFTPLQLANYLATLVNGGTRYKTHLIKSVRDSRTGEILLESHPEIVSKIDMSSENYNAVMQGMKNVIELGTASTVFEDFPIPIGGKTGTAEVPSGSDNAVFIGFAPFDNPTIAVCAFIEHGAHGASAGRVVRTVLESYFNSASQAKQIEAKNILTR